MQKLSVEHSLRWMQRFVAREWRLALPIALAFLALPQLAAQLFMPRRLVVMPDTIDQLRALGLALPWWWPPVMIVVLLCAVIGALALNALALVPRISVGEAILVGLRRAPSWIAAALLVGIVLFFLLVLLMTFAATARFGQLGILVLTTIGMLMASLYLVLLMPLVVDRGTGPLTTLREGWKLYRGVLGRLAAGMLLFLVGAWIVGIALQLALGSLLMIAARMSGQIELGFALMALLSSGIAAAEWAAFYLLVAALYRQRVGMA